MIEAAQPNTQTPPWEMYAGPQTQPAPQAATQPSQSVGNGKPPWEMYAGPQATNATTANATPPDEPQGIWSKAYDLVGKATNAVGGANYETLHGATQASARLLSHLINIVNDPDGSKGYMSDIPSYLKENPGATLGQAWDAIHGKGPDGKPITPYKSEWSKNNQQLFSEASDWLAKKGKPLGVLQSSPYSSIAGLAQLGGSASVDLAKYYGLEGLLGLGAAPAEAGEAGETASAVKELTTAAKLKAGGAVADVLAKYPMIGKLTSIGLRVAHTLLEGGPIGEVEKQTLLGGAQGGIESEGDPKKTTESALFAGLLSQTFESLVGPASEYLNKMRGAAPEAAAALGDTTGVAPPPVEHALPPKPVKPEFGPPPPKPTLPDVEPLGMEPPEKPTTIPKPTPPPPPTPSEPLTPTPFESEPEPPEPTDLPALHGPEQAPASDRLQQIEQDTAQAATVGNNAVAARHLESLNQMLIDNRNLRLPLNEAQKSEVLRLRDEMKTHIIEGTTPADAEQVAGSISDLGHAAEIMRAAPEAARARWNKMTGGQYETLNNELQKLSGKADQASIVQRGEVQKKLDELMSAPKFGDTATPAIRSAYDVLRSKADLLDGADTAFTKSYKGADRTGPLDLTALQTNWKNFVNKEGVPEISNAIGADRFTAINDFINNAVKEPEANKAAQQAAAKARNDVMDTWKQSVSDVQSLNAAKKATLKAQDSAAQKALNASDQAELAKHQQSVLDANNLIGAQNRAAKAEYASNLYEFNKAKRIRAQQIIDRKATLDTMMADHQKLLDSAGAAKTQALADHAKEIDAWKAETDRLEQINKANIGEYKAQQRAANATPAGANPNETAEQVVAAVMKLLPVKVKAPIGIAKTVGSLMKNIIVNPTAGRILASAIKSGGDPNIYGPVIAAIINEDVAKGGFNAGSQ